MRARHLSWLLAAPIMAAVLLIWLAQATGAQRSNDQLYNIATGIDLRDRPEPLRKFYDAAVSSCEGEQSCIQNQIVLVTEMPWNYPVAAVVGRYMAAGGIPDGFAAFAFKTTGLSLVAGFSIAVIIFLVGWLWLLPPPQGVQFAIIFLVGLAMLLWRPALPLPLNFLGLNRALTVGALMMMVIAVPLTIGLAVRSLSDLVDLRLLEALAILCLILIALSRIFSFAIVGPAAAGTAYLLFVLSAIKSRSDGYCIAALGLVIVTILSSDYFLEPLINLVPRSNGFLAALPLIVVLMLRPNSNAVFLLPLIAVFHVSSAALIAVMLFCSELWFTVLRRGSVKLLAVSGVMAAILLAYTRTFTGLTEQMVQWDVLAARLISWQSLSAVLIALAGMALSAIMAHRHASLPASNRAIMLTLGIFLISQIAGQLSSFNMFEAGMYAVTRAHVYCAPALLTASAVAILIETWRPSSPLPRLRISPSTASVCLLVLAAWNVPLGPTADKTYDAARDGFQSLSDPAHAAAGDFDDMTYDDRYFIRSGPDTATDSLKFLSYVKLRFKLLENAEDAERMEIIVKR